MIVIYLYLIIINVISFIIYGIDKRKAKKSLWRISEATLIWFALIGGSIGAYMGMKMFHHKTKHKKFSIGVPLIFILQLLIAFILWSVFLHR